MSDLDLMARDWCEEMGLEPNEHLINAFIGGYLAAVGEPE